MSTLAHRAQGARISTGALMHREWHIIESLDFSYYTEDLQNQPTRLQIQYWNLRHRRRAKQALDLAMRSANLPSTTGESRVSRRADCGCDLGCRRRLLKDFAMLTNLNSTYMGPPSLFEPNTLVLNRHEPIDEYRIGWIVLRICFCGVGNSMTYKFLNPGCVETLRKDILKDSPTRKQRALPPLGKPPHISATAERMFSRQHAIRGELSFSTCRRRREGRSSQRLVEWRASPSM
jgi:hypothetical protein